MKEFKGRVREFRGRVLITAEEYRDLITSNTRMLSHLAETRQEKYILECRIEELEKKLKEKDND